MSPQRRHAQIDADRCSEGGADALRLGHNSTHHLDAAIAKLIDAPDHFELPLPDRRAEDGRRRFQSGDVVAHILADGVVEGIAGPSGTRRHGRSEARDQGREMAR
jgi:hypothetical protein